LAFLLAQCGNPPEIRLNLFRSIGAERSKK
jgi:hypothetical protein